LKGLIGLPEITRETLEELRSASTPPDDIAEPDFSFEEQQQIAVAYQEQHYRGLVDEIVPMLGNKTPRQAAKSAKGKSAVVKWLKYLENQSAKGSASGIGVAYDFTWMWEELGILDLRR
jgi:hypothetical protein